MSFSTELGFSFMADIWSGFFDPLPSVGPRTVGMGNLGRQTIQGHFLVKH